MTLCLSPGPRDPRLIVWSKTRINKYRASRHNEAYSPLLEFYLALVPLAFIDQILPFTFWLLSSAACSSSSKLSLLGGCNQMFSLSDLRLVRRGLVRKLLVQSRPAHG